jgi:ATP-binding cassette, subfamily B, bacterial
MISLKGLKENTQILWFFFRPHKWYMCVVFFAMVFSGLLESLNLAALYPIINYGLKIEAQSFTLQFLDQLIGLFGAENKFRSACLLLITITVAATSARIFFNYCASRLIAHIVSINQNDLFYKYAHADYKYFVENQQGRLIYAGTVAPMSVAQNILCSIRVVNNVMTSFFFAILLFMLAWQGAVLILFIGAFYVLFIKKLITNIVSESAHIYVEEDNKKNVVLNEFITGIKTVRAFLSNQFWKDKYGDAVGKSVYYNFRVMMGRTLPESFLKFTFFIIIALAGIAFSFQGSGNILPMVPLLGTFVAVASRLLPYLNLVGNDLVNISRFIPDTKIVYNILTEEINEIKDGIDNLDCFNREIVFDDVRFQYDGMDEDLLKGVSFNIEKNKMTAIVGASGSGKSTIVSLLLRLYEVQKGKITIDGLNIINLTSESYLRKIGYVSQETFIFNGTIEDNIRFGLDDCSEKEIVEAAKLANAHDFIVKAEHSYKTIVGDAGIKLSGGQRQRVAIARAMLRRPQIMVLDEATSALDNISEKAVQEAINNIARNTTVVIIAHRLSTVQDADKIIVLDCGRIIEEGTHQDLFGKRNTYFDLYKNA